MKRALPLLTIFIMSIIQGFSQQKTGYFDGNEDVGNPIKKGTATYNAETQEYTMSCGGKNMWANDDQFRFLWKKIKGDFMISATVRFIGAGVDPHRKIGIMARNNLTANSPYADACVHGDGLTSLQSRHADTAQTLQVILPTNGGVHIELQRTGNIFTFSSATSGENYKTATKELVLNDEVYAGLFICSHNENVVEQAVFSNVRVTIPPEKNWVPYRDYIGSHLEVMDVSTGHRKILHSATNSLQAPNWATDNKCLMYSSDGLLYRYDLKTGVVSKINTGPVNDLNNDHVLSMDGKMFGLSNHLGNRSTIFIMPAEGSDNPVQITSDSLAPSYLHGWSPDKKTLIFTGRRKEKWEIVAIDIATKKEKLLTNNNYLDDGSEYTPDGKWIYFNSARTGTMKIWRMKPNGSNQEQVTFDEYNDWFPHISPDQKWIVYLSYPKDIDPTSHPFYEKVYIRLMPYSGGVPKNIAYVFGGQGTINVPSWSPDSKRIAFISNTQLK